MKKLLKKYWLWRVSNADIKNEVIRILICALMCMAPIGYGWKVASVVITAVNVVITMAAMIIGHPELETEEEAK